MVDLLREIAQTLSNNRLRTFLTGIAVAWGIFMLIVLLGMARGVVNSFENANWAKTSNRIVVYQGMTSKPHRGLKEGRKIQPRVDDMDLIENSESEHVEDVTSYTSLPSTIFSTPKDYISSTAQGVFPYEGTVDNLDIKAGRFINEADIREKRKTLVLEQKDAESLFGDAQKAVGQRIDGLGLSWLVVGVYSHDWRNDIYVPFSTAKMLTGNDRTTENLEVRIKNVKSLDDGQKVEGDLRNILAQEHEFSPSDESALYFYNQFTDYLRNRTTLSILDWSVWIIGIFTLLSGIVGVSNIMFVSVKERTHEIGIRRAIGAKPSQILVQIISESVIITTLFGYIGIFFGMCLTQLIALLTKDTDFLKNPTVSLEIALEVTCVLILAGALAGLFPALKATKVKPVEALRDE